MNEHEYKDFSYNSTHEEPLLMLAPSKMAELYNKFPTQRQIELATYPFKRTMFLQPRSVACAAVNTLKTEC